MADLTLHVDTRWEDAGVFHAVVALEEKQLPYAVVVETWPLAAERRHELMARATFGELPLLVHGELAVTGAVVISEYLAEQFPFPAHPRLFPADYAQRARARQLLSFLHREAEAPNDDELRRVATRLVAAGRSSIFDAWCIADADLARALLQCVARGGAIPGHVEEYARTVWARPSVRAFVAQRS